MDKNLNGKNALVVGGTSSVGLALAEQLSLCGAEVHATGTHIPEPDAMTGGETDISNIHFHIHDFEKNGIESVLEEPFNSLLKKADILAVCYGPFVRKPIFETNAEDWKKLALMDYALPGLLVSESLKRMMNRRWGRIILFGGTRTDSIRNYKNVAAYSGAKTGLGVLVKSVAAEYRQYNITCNAILPGFTRNAPENAEPVTEAELAECALNFTLKPSFNGVLLNVDGGWTP